MLVQERHIQPGTMNSDDRAALLASLRRATDTQTGAQMQILRDQQDERARSHRPSVEAKPNLETRHRRSEKLGSLVISEIKDRFTKYIARPIGRLASAAVGLFRPSRSPAPAPTTLAPTNLAPQVSRPRFTAVDLDLLSVPTRYTPNTSITEARTSLHLTTADREFLYGGGIRHEQTTVVAVGSFAIDAILTNLADNLGPDALTTAELAQINTGLNAADPSTRFVAARHTTSPFSEVEQMYINRAVDTAHYSQPFAAFAIRVSNS